MPLKQKTQYDGNLKTKEYYYQQFLEGGSYYENVQKNKVDDVSASYDQLFRWIDGQLEDGKIALANAESQEEIDTIQNKIIASWQVVRTQNDVLSKKIYGNNVFHAPQEYYDLYTKARETFHFTAKVTDDLVHLVNSQNPAEDLMNVQQEIVNQQEAKEQRRVNQYVIKNDERQQEYEKEVAEKYNAIEKAYNDGMKVNFSPTIKNYERSLSISNQWMKKEQPILAMVEDFNETTLAEHYNDLEEFENKYISPERAQIEEMAFDDATSKDAFAIKLSQYENHMTTKKEDLTENVKALMEAKMGLYIATKRKMDDRGFFSKLFHPKRTKKENAMFAEMREGLKKDFGFSEEYMAGFDTSIAKNDKFFMDTPVATVNKEVKSINYQGMITDKAELYGREMLKADIALDTEMRNVKDLKGKFKTATEIVEKKRQGIYVPNQE